MDTLSENQFRKITHNACKPLIKMAIDYGITAKQFNSAITECFVSVASETFGIKGRSANISRVAVLTGLSRKEISRIREQSNGGDGRELLRATPIGRILAAWHNDPEFVDKSGRPIPLSYDGKDCSFEALAKKYIGDIPPSALLKELERHDLVAEDSSGRIKPLAQAHIPRRASLRSLDRLGEVVGEVGGTIVKNLDDNKKKLFERRVLSGNISNEQTQKFHVLVEQQGSKFLGFLEAWLFENGLSDIEADETANSNRAGVGVYFFEEGEKSGSEE